MEAHMEGWLLARLVCPVSRQRLRHAAKDDVAMILTRMEADLNLPEDLDLARVDGWLVTEDGHRAYPIIGEIPHLLTDLSMIL
jgi:uncharacterized protein YbaR (Trm112 family)